MTDVLLTILLTVMVLCLCSVLLAGSVLLFLLVRRVWREERNLG